VRKQSRPIGRERRNSSILIGSPAFCFLVPWKGTFTKNQYYRDSLDMSDISLYSMISSMSSLIIGRSSRAVSGCRMITIGGRLLPNSPCAYSLYSTLGIGRGVAIVCSSGITGSPFAFRICSSFNLFLAKVPVR
jgi:hypothetical protein